MPDAMLPTATFDEASHVVLRYLHEHVPLGFWAITRVENGRQTYLYLDENTYGLRRGESHPWADSLCQHMADGSAPSVAPDTQAVHAYATAAVNAVVPIGAYGGARIDEADGTLFGAICGLDPAPQGVHSALATAEPLLALLGDLLGLVLGAERARNEARDSALRAIADADVDALTGLPNRRAWDRVLAEEAPRFAQFADPTVLVMVDLDQLKAVNDSLGHAAGDEHLCLAAHALTSGVRSHDVVARLGGDEFAVLLRSCDEAAAPERVEQLRSALSAAGVSGSFGWAPVTVVRGLSGAVADADAAMYVDKRRGRAPSVPSARVADAAIVLPDADRRDASRSR